MWQKFLELIFGYKPPGTSAGVQPIGGTISIKVGSGHVEEENVKPAVIWEPSPNFTSDPDRKITLIVVHATATSKVVSPLSWLCNPAAKASAHYLIDREGIIYQLVDDKHISWHAGISKWKGMEWTNPRTGNTTVNNCSIGIELVNSNTGKQEYPKIQIYSCARLCKYLKREYEVKEKIVGHLHVAPGRKDDPKEFDWEALKQGMQAI